MLKKNQKLSSFEAKIHKGIYLLIEIFSLVMMVVSLFDHNPEWAILFIAQACYVHLRGKNV
jgi:hypothetical protein